MNLREQYNRDGYGVLKNIFKIIDLPVFSVPWLKEEFSKGEDHYINLIKCYSASYPVCRAFFEPSIKHEINSVGLGDLILIGTPVVHIISPDFRISGGYYGAAAHQDWPSTQGSLDMVTVWIPLTDASIGNFPLEVIPGSHKQGLRDGKMNGSVLEVEADDKEFHPIECKVGDVVLMSGFTVHRTGPGAGFRAAVSQRFDNAAEPTFIERGYPCAQKRVVDREIKWRPTKEQIEAVYA